MAENATTSEGRTTATTVANVSIENPRFFNGEAGSARTNRVSIFESFLIYQHFHPEPLTFIQSLCTLRS